MPILERGLRLDRATRGRLKTTAFPDRRPADAGETRNGADEVVQEATQLREKENPKRDEIRRREETWCTRQELNLEPADP